MPGALLKGLINTWIATTGRKRSLEADPWLEGPTGDEQIGSSFYQTYARAEGLQTFAEPDAGLLADFRKVIAVNDPHRDKLKSSIIHFYEHTAAYKLEVWSQWFRPMRFFARTLVGLVSTKMDQLNIPLNPLETSRGMSNEVIRLVPPGATEQQAACWLRKSIQNGKVVYAGFYSPAERNGLPMVRVVFPLPAGNATVLLRTEVQPDGSVKLLSDGKRYGDAGYYRLRRSDTGYVRVKYIPIKESIHVFEDAEGVLRTDHLFWFMGFKLLHLHYKILPR
ncbi:hypothetical protein [Taibaiella chishuiensis]|uniref:Uncharacterized protein n=1 Tax=Taibaiella chishuiensis TaxID=1434707 RepID=A0A2P8CVA1_9BACT|nr:hypothetical protein [Taibaiella chishuiensis]PSK88869.1 hypothetical protein B0I18_11481 [Taibaiella chishuiensis]